MFLNKPEVFHNGYKTFKLLDLDGDGLDTSLFPWTMQTRGGNGRFPEGSEGTSENITMTDKKLEMVSLSGKIARYKVFVNVGGSEMAFNNGGDERIAFGTMAKGQKKYGSTSSRQRRNEHVVVYDVQRADTLQGIAIKFGVTTEQIRRVNHLWTNDSLFLRDKLLIPVCEGDERVQDESIESLDANVELNSSFGNCSNLSSPLGLDGGFKMELNCSHPLCDSFESEDCVGSLESVRISSRSSHPDLNGSSMPWKHQGGSNLADTSPNGRASCNGVHSQISYGGNKYSSVDKPTSSIEFNQLAVPDESPLSPTSASSSRRCTIVDHSEKSAEDFLSRIDTAIASSKMQAKNKSEDEKSPWVTFDSDSESDQRFTYGTSITRQGRHLRCSLRKLEKKQEELFQL